MDRVLWHEVIRDGTSMSRTIAYVAVFSSCHALAKWLLSREADLGMEGKNMRRILGGIVLAVALIVPVLGFAQQSRPPKEEGGTLELKRQGPPVVAPTPESPEAIGEAERSVEELKRKQRQEQLLRETAPSPPSRPDLDYDVKSGIQQKAIEKALPPK